MGHWGSKIMENDHAGDELQRVRKGVVKECKKHIGYVLKDRGGVDTSLALLEVLHRIPEIWLDRAETLSLSNTPGFREKVYAQVPGWSEPGRRRRDLKNFFSKLQRACKRDEDKFRAKR